MKEVKIGLFGLGYFGNFHLNNLLQTPFNVIGFFEVNEERAIEIENKYGIKRYVDPTRLILDSDAVDITTPTTSHFKLIKKALSLGKHVFVEKPMTSNAKEAKEILEMVTNSKLKLQVGHIERYNPIITELDFSNDNIINIEANRLSTYNPRGTDVSVVFDLMIHDIYQVLHLISDDVETINASGYHKYGDNTEFATANIKFKNGATATLNSSIIHPYMERKMKIWTKENYYELDLADKSGNIYEYLNKAEEDNNIIKDKVFLKKDPNNSILDELNGFYTSIVEKTETNVTVTDGFNAIKIAETIQNLIK